jgi:GTP-binding protein HflX
MSTPRVGRDQPPLERAALISLTTRATRGTDPDIAMEELSGLADAAGAEVVLRAIQERPSPDPATLIGRGKAEELAVRCDEAGATLAIFENELTPAQSRNLEKTLGRRVIDRTAVILDIFARRARTREGKLQIELAQLQYLMPRLAGAGVALSRLGGGIGTRGPGETKLETDRRRIRHRIAGLKRDIADVKRRRGHLRTRRQRREVPTVALVGYTNAGKTTVFNMLTSAGAHASDALFVTLDPLMRRVKLPDARQILISDTVGFLDRLPHQLVAAFHATLEEVAGADLLLHVIDAAAPDRDRRMNAVRGVLFDVGAGQTPVLEVFNKRDLLTDGELARLRSANPAAVFVSAKSGAGRSDLVDILSSRLAMDVERLKLEFDSASEGDRRLLSDLYRHSRVVSHVATGDTVLVEAEVPRRMVERFSGTRTLKLGA